MHFHNHSLAHQWMNYLRQIGLQAKMIHKGGHFDVFYHMHGKRTRTFISHAAAHVFQRTLQRLGVHADIVHH